MVRLSSILLVAPVGVALACGDLFGPNVDHGTYVLTSLAGTPAPFVVSDVAFPDGGRELQLIAADTFEFLDATVGRRARRSLKIVWDSAGAVDTLFHYYSLRGSYQIRDRLITMHYDYANLSGGPPEPTADTLYLEDDGRLRRSEPVYPECTPASCPRRLQSAYYSRP